MLFGQSCRLEIPRPCKEVPMYPMDTEVSFFYFKRTHLQPSRCAPTLIFATFWSTSVLNYSTASYPSEACKATIRRGPAASWSARIITFPRWPESHNRAVAAARSEILLFRRVLLTSEKVTTPFWRPLRSPSKKASACTRNQYI